MTTAPSPATTRTWASAAAGLFVALLVILLITRATSPAERTEAAPQNDEVASTVVDDTATGPEGSTPAVPVPSTTVAETVPPTTAPPGPTVNITRSIGPCKFGPECLIASFTIANFDDQPPEFVCEFGDGSRFNFRLNGDGQDPACSTSTKPGSIVIEVGGVRSEPITNP